MVLHTVRAPRTTTSQSADHNGGDIGTVDREKTDPITAGDLQPARERQTGLCRYWPKSGKPERSEWEEKEHLG